MSVPVRPHRSPTALPEFLFGSAYYPEHWDETLRATDPALLAAAGWNVVRMGEFAWDRLEPEPDCFDFSLFDDAIARFAAVGIRTILCTPTASPPRWLSQQHPEILGHDENGSPLAHGSRQHASRFSPVFRARSRRITQAMTNHYAAHPQVIGWQTDNEFHCHFAEDHSPAAAAAFTAWLRTRFGGDIGALNEAWGTAFWAQTYEGFGQVPIPRPRKPTYLNPAHVLDYHRFLADGVASFQREQVVILREANPRWWITHNGCFRFIDYAGAFGADLDFLSYDSYPFFQDDGTRRPAAQAFNTDYVRAYSGNFVVMEQQSGPGGQGDYLHDTPEPGEMRRLAWVNIARGADGLLFFRERSCRFGAEQYWCGVLDHDNVPRRRYHEAARLGDELRRLGPVLLGTAVEIEIGVAGGDFTAQHGHLALSHGLPDPKAVAEGIHGRFYAAGQAVGCVHPADSLAGLRLYLVPHLATFDPAWLPGWTAWVEAGGVLVVGARTGAKDVRNNVVPETPPGRLRDLAGLTVEEYGRQNRPHQRPLQLLVAHAPAPVLSEFWYEVLRPAAGTEVVGTWAGRQLSGQPAVTLRRAGRGAVIYVGTYLTPAVVDALLPLLANAGVFSKAVHHVEGVEQVVRAGRGRRLRFLINHREEPVEVALARPGLELIAGRPVADRLMLAAGEVAIVQEDGSPAAA